MAVRHRLARNQDTGDGGSERPSGSRFRWSTTARPCRRTGADRLRESELVYAGARISPEFLFVRRWDVARGGSFSQGRRGPFGQCLPAGSNHRGEPVWLRRSVRADDPHSEFTGARHRHTEFQRAVAHRPGPGRHSHDAAHDHAEKNQGDRLAGRHHVLRRFPRGRFGRPEQQITSFAPRAAPSANR